MDTTLPYISFVTAVRNDEYADPKYKKLKYNLTLLSQQCEEYSLRAENLLVEWNPDPLKEPMSDALADLRISDWLTIRIITVPSIFHKQWKLNELRPVHPSVAINVGLRRARGQFCTLKTQDTFYDDSLMKFIAQRNLEWGKLYRTVRLDVSPVLGEKLFIDRATFLRNCREHIVYRNDPLPISHIPFFIPNLFTNACGDFQLMAKEHFFELRGYSETKDVRAYEVDGLLSFAAYGNGIQEVILEPSQAVYKISHSLINKTRFDRPSPLLTTYEKFFLALELFWPFSISLFLMHVLFNYPRKFCRGKPIRCYERSLLLFKLFSTFPWMIKLKTSKWGYPNKRFKESCLSSKSTEKSTEPHFINTL